MGKPALRIVPHAVHPSVFIREELKARRWSIADLAKRMPGEYGVNYLAVDMYLTIGPDTPDIRIAGETANALATAFDVDPDLFVNLERAWLAEIGRAL